MQLDRLMAWQAKLYFRQVRRKEMCYDRLDFFRRYISSCFRYVLARGNWRKPDKYGPPELVFWHYMADYHVLGIALRGFPEIGWMVRMPQGIQAWLQGRLCRQAKGRWHLLSGALLRWLRLRSRKGQSRHLLAGIRCIIKIKRFVELFGLFFCKLSVVLYL